MKAIVTKLPNGDYKTPKGVVPARLVKGPVDLQALEEGCWYSKRKADHVVMFFNQFLHHSKGEWAGKPFGLLEWQEWDFIRPLFGWMRADGTRRFRRAYVEVPKKNGKSTLCAGIALYLMIGDGEPGAEVYSAAADKDQASIVYHEAANMVEASPSLKDRIRTVDSKKTLSDEKSKSVYRALSADVPTKEGLNIHGLIFDELHAQKERLLWDTLKYGGAARRQPLFVSITTAGSDRTTICYEQHKYARNVLKGTVLDTSFFALVYGARMKDNWSEVEDDWEDPEIWAKANPSYGITIKADQFKADYLESVENQGSENSFRRYRLNQWTQQEKRWLSMTQWRACKKVAPKLADKQIPFIGALDLASTQDIAAYVQLFYTEGFYFKCHFFIPEDRLKARVKKDKVPYDLWARQKWLTPTRGNTIDEEHIIEVVLKSGEQHQCEEIGYDPWNAPHIVTRLQDEGVKLEPVRQGFVTLNYPSKEIEKRIIKGALNHGGNPVLEWMASNVAVETDAHENIKPSKRRSGEKIDGIVAMVMATQRYLVLHAPVKSKYEKEGITFL